MGWGELLKIAGLLVLLWLCWRVLVTWLKVRAGGPDFVINGGGASPAQKVAYLRRWWVLPRNPVCGIYLHQILRDDDDRALHDHPWPNISIVLRGGYHEVTPLFGPGEPGTSRFWRGPGSVVLRRATAAHRLVVGDGMAWTLFLTGPRLRDWGFWCARGWVPKDEFVDLDNRGAIGKGCGEGITSNVHYINAVTAKKATEELSPGGWPAAVEFHGDR